MSETREQIAALVRAGAKRVTDRVREMHRESPETGKCVECTPAPYSMFSVPWPCPTVRLLDQIDAELGADS